MVNVAQLLLEFSKLSKAEVKQFTASMNQYLIASPLTRRQMATDWEEESHPRIKKEST